MRVWPGSLLVLAASSLVFAQCSKASDSETESTGRDAGAADAAHLGDAAVDAPWPGYNPYNVTPASVLSAPRNFVLHRGTIHLHSVYSWDADDQLGFVNDAGVQDYDGGHINQPYYDDLRKGLCNTAQEFAFLTDHVDYFPDFEFPDVLLYRADLGDQLILQNGNPVAVKLACPGAAPVLLSAGCDYNTIAMGLEQHVAATPDERKLVYGQATPEAYATLRANGALVLAAYLPRWIPTPDGGTAPSPTTPIPADNLLFTLKFDGLENYNPLFNFTDRIGDALSLIIAMKDHPTTVPVPELGLIAIFEENPTILAAWSQMAQKARVPAFIGSNAHENLLPQLTPDGERLDSYRRMLHWWSNYVMLPKGTEVTTASLKTAIAAGQTYGAFDYLGYATGFDFHAEAGGQTYEMGSQIPPGQTATLVAVAPEVYGLKSIDPVPVITVDILQAEGTGWTVVASGSGTVKFPVTTNGVYRAEARIIPKHLTHSLGSSPDQYLSQPYLWVYGNTIWVGTSF